MDSGKLPNYRSSYLLRFHPYPRVKPSACERVMVSLIFTWSLAALTTHVLIDCLGNRWWHHLVWWWDFCTCLAICQLCLCGVSFTFSITFYWCPWFQDLANEKQNLNDAIYATWSFDTFQRWLSLSSLVVVSRVPRVEQLIMMRFLLGPGSLSCLQAIFKYLIN